MATDIKKNDYGAERAEAQKRFASLSEILKKEISADKTVQLVSSICQDYNIPEDKVKHVALLVGEVFLGYIKPEELAHELNTYFDVDLQKANFIEIELKQKLFSPLKAELEKVYNPPTIEGVEETTEEAEPAIIKLDNSVKLEKEAAPISSIPAAAAIPLQKPSEIIREKNISAITATAAATTTAAAAAPIKQVNFSAQPAVAKQEAPASEGPVIIQIKSEPTKPLTPQFPKETPSLNLKVDESLIQKQPAVKPISVHLEAEQRVSNGPKFQMPVIPSKPAAQPEQKPAAPAQKPIAPIEANPVSVKPEPQKIEIPIKTSPIPAPTAPAPTLKQLSEEPIKAVHYSAFKTPLTPAGTPKKQEQTKESEFINLSTFTKVSGNTVDLRKSENK